MSRVLVFGGRWWARSRYGAFDVSEEAKADHARARHEHLFMQRYLDASGITHLIAGGAPGADTAAEQWAKACGIPFTIFRAQWRLHGNAAGPLRNQQMLDEGHPERAIGFPGGAGTEDMARRVLRAGLPLERPRME